MYEQEIKAMHDATTQATPEEIAAKVREIIRILAGLLDKLNGKLNIWTIITNAGAIIDAIKAIIAVIKAKA